MVPRSPFDIATSTLPEVMTCKRLPAALGEEELHVEAGLLEHALLLGELQERQVPEAALRDRDLELVLRLRGRGETPARIARSDEMRLIIGFLHCRCRQDCRKPASRHNREYRHR